MLRLMYVHVEKKSPPSGHLVPKWRRINVDATSSRRIDIYTTSFLRHVPAGLIRAVKWL